MNIGGCTIHGYHFKVDNLYDNLFSPFLAKENNNNNKERAIITMELQYYIREEKRESQTNTNGQ